MELAHLRDPSLVEQTVARALGIRGALGHGGMDDLVVHLANKQVLLILDNCEHLLNECAQLADKLVRNTPKLSVLATSREALRIQGEIIAEVRPLACPQPGEPLDPAEAVRYPAVALLLDRITAVRPEFTLGRDNVEAVTQLCRRLDGLPLAIELAAIRAQTLPVQQIVERLDNRFVLLRTGMRGGHARQRTMEALVDWSFELCTEAEQALWASLSVFEGGFEVGDAEEVCSGRGLSRAQVTEALLGLVEKSIVCRSAVGAESRLFLLETMREYGRIRLAERGEVAAYRRRHRDWYYEWGHRVSHEWYGPSQLDWLARLTHDHANLRAALTFSFDTPGESGAGLRLICGLRPWWVVGGFLTECSQWLRRGLAQYPDRDATRAWAVLVDGTTAMYLGESQEAERRLSEAEELITELDDAELRANLLTSLGQLALYQTDHRRAAALLPQALAEHQARGNTQGIIESMLPLALAMSVAGDSQTVVELCDRLQRICVDRGETVGRSYALWTIAMEYWRGGDASRTKQLLQECLQLKAGFDDRLGIALCFEGLAWVAVGEGQVGRAAKLLGASEPVSRHLGLSLGKYQHLIEHVEQCRRWIREAADQERVQAAHDEGTAMSLVEAIDYALESHPARTDIRDQLVAGLDDLSILTPREREVVHLVAAGLTNRAIATQLVISRRTAEGHVERILAKLGFTSRAQIASWSASISASVASPAE
ncbi:LuxR C-terminal-related transcriptional regulator [Streptomyces sp. NPDC005480]|uniref:ATP-binding protein n=1 Tax=Streptomyces sp. NPDC005480 TaxID=3154880 RepID=UPI0033A08EE8